jgi:hypothetical protein
MLTKSKITMTLVAAAIALASPTLAAGNGNRDNGSTPKLSQYCVPQDDFPGAQTVYC